MATENVLPLLLVLFSSKDNIVHKLSHHAETPALSNCTQEIEYVCISKYASDVLVSNNFFFLQKKWFSQKL